MPAYNVQDTRNKTNTLQSENQGLVVRNSHTVEVTQTEVQGLIIVQAALQAAIEAAISVLSSEDRDVQELKAISQSLDANQLQSQNVIIEDSGEVTVTQAEIQVDVVVQAAINLLAKLTADIG